MSKYIDAEKLATIIEERKAQQDQWINRYHDPINQGISHELTEIISIITSLQQEQPKKSQKNCNNCSHCVDRKDQFGWHFKGCFGGPYNGKFIAEIDECPLEQEQPEVDLEKAARYVYESWMGGTMDDVRRDMVELGKVLNARKEE